MLLQAREIQIFDLGNALVEEDTTCRGMSIFICTESITVTSRIASADSLTAEGRNLI